MRTYTITKKTTSFSWEQVPVLPIDTLLWSPQVPITAQAQICYDSDALYVRFSAVEPEIRAEETGPLGSPCCDSCLEFFFSPIPEDSRYFNVEFNPNGCMFLGFGSNRYNLMRLLPLENPIVPQITRTQDGWVLEYSIPCSFIRQFFPDFTPAAGSFIRANCYKCGDETLQPHYFSWNPIETETPDYHCPQYFGNMWFE